MATTRGLSQPNTSFFASWHQGIHQTLLVFYSIHLRLCTEQNLLIILLFYLRPINLSNFSNNTLRKQRRPCSPPKPALLKARAPRLHGKKNNVNGSIFTDFTKAMQQSTCSEPQVFTNEYLIFQICILEFHSFAWYYKNGFKSTTSRQNYLEK